MANPPVRDPNSLNIAFVHPDLGIGGAERLVVDAALGLQRQGHNVTIYTSYFDPDRAFEELKSGKIDVVVKGHSLPREILGGKGHIVFAILKSWILGLFLMLITLLGPPDSRPDIFIVDQLSSSIPILRITSRKILFYCHFPDKLLSTGRESLLKRIYRFPIDVFEEITTKMADVIVVNSEFTGGVFRNSFKFIPIQPQVLYPGISLTSYDKKVDLNDKAVQSLGLVKTSSPTMPKKFIVSINRFERKKNIGLCIEAFAMLKKSHAKEFVELCLVIAGGYDSRVSENVGHLKELQDLAHDLELESHVIWNDSKNTSIKIPPVQTKVLFVPSFSDAQRTFFLANALCLVYTPSNEHFGIVPLEGMYSRLPVVAVNSGGPMETIIDGKTGFLCEPTPTSFSSAMASIVFDPSRGKAMGVAGREHVSERFTLGIFAESLERIVKETMKSDNLDAAITFYCFILFVGTIIPLTILISSSAQSVQQV